jgi:hypothetical protein
MIISKRIEQIRPLADSMIPTHEDNSMIICYSPNHPVADVVVYSGGYINFISISVSSYSVHRTKFEDLFTLTVGETGLTVFSYYCLAAPKSYNAAMIAEFTKLTKHVREKVRFIYVTTDETKHHLNTRWAEYVHRINGNALEKFGDCRVFKQE